MRCRFRPWTAINAFDDTIHSEYTISYIICSWSLYSVYFSMFLRSRSPYRTTLVHLIFSDVCVFAVFFFSSKYCPLRGSHSLLSRWHRVHPRYIFLPPLHKLHWARGYEPSALVLFFSRCIFVFLQSVLMYVRSFCGVDFFLVFILCANATEMVWRARVKPFDPR